MRCEKRVVVKNEFAKSYKVVVFLPKLISRLLEPRILVPRLLVPHILVSALLARVSHHKEVTI